MMKVNNWNSPRCFADFTIKHVNLTNINMPQKNVFCLLVFFNTSHSCITGNEILDKIIHVVGLKYVYQYNSISKLSSDTLVRFVLIRGAMSRIQLKAEAIGFKLLLDPTRAEQAASRGNPTYNVAPFDISHDPSHSKFQPFEYIYAPYVQDEDLQDLYWRPEGSTNPFRSTVRLRLLMKIIEEGEGSGGAGLNVRELVHRGIIIDAFPLHDKAVRKRINYEWLDPSVAPWKQPLDDISDYWGEKVALSFAFKGYLTAWFIVPAILGVALQIDTRLKNNSMLTSNFQELALIPAWATLMCLWTCIVVQRWKYIEKVFLMNWGIYDKGLDGPQKLKDDKAEGQADEDEEEKVRFDFKGVEKPSLSSNGSAVYVQGHVQALRIFISAFVIVSLVVFVGFLTAGLYVLRHKFVNTSYSSYFNPTYQQWIVSAINAVGIDVANAIFSVLAMWVTLSENHRTDREFEHALVAKIFVFQFVSNFASFYYLTFGAGAYGAATYNADGSGASFGTNNNLTLSACANGDCTEALAINLVTILGYRCFRRVIFGYTGPFVLKCFTRSWSRWRAEVMERRENGQFKDADVKPEPDELDCCENSLICDIFDKVVDWTYNKGCCPPGCSDGYIRSLFRNKYTRYWCRWHMFFRKVYSYMFCCCCCCPSRQWLHALFGFDILHCCLGPADSLDTYAIEEEEEEERQEKAGKPHAQVDLERERYEPYIECINSYMDQIIQLGHCTLFVTMLPCAPFFALLANYISIRGDAWRTLNQCRRPVPVSSHEGIGAMHTLLFIMALLVAFTNGAIIVFNLNITNMDVWINGAHFSPWSITQKLLFFIGYQWFFLGLQYIMHLFNRVPSAVKTQHDRTKFIVSKLILRKGDGEADPLELL